MTTYDELYIFFDTNKLEARVDKRVFLQSVTFKNDYYDVENLVKDINLTDKIHLCIPEIAWREIAEHMRKDYCSNKKSIMDKIKYERKMFGSLIDIEVSFPIGNISDYDVYLSQIQKEFLDNPKFIGRVVPYPKEPEVMELLIEKATHSISPFAQAKGKKEYSDAGFKDAVIFETFVRQTKDNCLGVLFTNDYDFDGALEKVNKDNLKCIHDYNDLKTLIYSNFEIKDDEIAIEKIKNDEYLYAQICEEVGIMDYGNFVCEDISDVHETDEGLGLTLTLRINGDVEKFNIVYDVNASQLCYAEYVSE